MAALGIGAVGWGIVSHAQRDARASETQREIADFRPLVHVVTARQNSVAAKLVLPASTAAFDEAQISARATGYLSERAVDIGSRVKAGDLLARISSPDLDHQLRQAEATLKQRAAALKQSEAAVIQAKSNWDLATLTDGRISKLAKDGWATLQNADQTRLGLAAQAATLRSAEANVLAAQADYEAQAATLDQFQELASFERVVAPFDGVVTERNVSVGDLIRGTVSGGTPMFVLQRDDVLRIKVDVPQSSAANLRDGLEARIRVPELPDEDFRGLVTRNAASLKPGSRTLSAEIDVQNSDHRLHPGLFCYVEISIPQTRVVIVLPSNALIFNGQGLRVAVLGDDDVARMADVTVYRDFGTSVELLGGLKGGERIIVGAPANLTDGSPVRLADAEKPKLEARRGANRVE